MNCICLRGGAISLSPSIDNSICPDGSVGKIHVVTELNMIFFRLYIKAGTAYTAGTLYVPCTIPEGYRPNSIWALNVYEGSTATTSAYIGSNGQVKFKATNSDISSSFAIYISGCWIING